MTAASSVAISRRFEPWQLKPSASVRFLGSGQWHAEDDDPQLILWPPDGRIRPGVYELRVNCSQIAELPLTPRLYFDVGRGYNEADALQLPTIASSFARLVAIPAGTVSVRFDPIAQSGRFALDDVEFRRLNLVEFVSQVMRRPQRRRRALATLLTRGARETLAQIEVDPRSAASNAYDLWLSRYEPSPTESTERIRAYVSALPRRPLISVAMAAHNSDTRWLREAIDSVRRQIYPAWELCIVDDGSPKPDVWQTIDAAARLDSRIKARRLTSNGGISAATNAALSLAKGEWVAFMDHDDLMRPDALSLVADAIAKNVAARIIYTDEDKIDESGRRSEPYMKGAWNRELFYSQNVLNHLTVIRRDIIDAAGPLRSEFDGSQDYDLLLRCIEKIDDNAIIHLPFICYHWRFGSQRSNFSQRQSGRALQSGLAALQDHFRRTGLSARAERAAPNSFYVRPKWSLEQNPLVSLIIPTRDRKAVLETAVQSIRDYTTYPNYEILIVDNDSTERVTLDYFECLEREKAARIIRAPGPFNFSRINNIAAKQARGSILGFVNNDVEVRNGGWLEELVSHFARKDVGATGAKLYYADGRIQHAGVVTGIGGVAGHLYKLFPGDADGPFSLLRLPREVSAVTAACLMVRADLFTQIGGFNESDLAVAFNDVDLCLRIRATGAKIIWTPFAELTHFESISRGADTDPGKQDRFQREVRKMIEMWRQDVLDNDPYYSPNLTLKEENGALSLPPRVKRPWDN